MRGQSMAKIGKLLSPSKPALGATVVLFNLRKKTTNKVLLTFIPFVFILQGALKIGKNVLERKIFSGS